MLIIFKTVQSHHLHFKKICMCIVMHSWLIKAIFHCADKRNVQNNDCLSAKHKCVNFGSGAVTKPNEFKKCLSHPFCFRVSFSSNAAQYGIVISQSSCNIWGFELWGVTTGHVLLQIELLEKSQRFLLTTSASHCHFNAPQASVLAQVMMRSVCQWISAETEGKPQTEGSRGHHQCVNI